MLQFLVMDETPRSIAWEAPEHNHTEKSSDWFWALAILTIAATATSLLFGNILFALVLALSGGVTGIAASRQPRTIPFAVTVRGIRIDNQIFPYGTLMSYCIDEENPLGPNLLLKSKKTFMPLLVIPIPDEYTDDIEDIIKAHLPEEHLEEPFFNKLLEFLGF